MNETPIDPSTTMTMNVGMLPIAMRPVSARKRRKRLMPGLTAGGRLSSSSTA